MERREERGAVKGEKNRKDLKWKDMREREREREIESERERERERK